MEANWTRVFLGVLIAGALILILRFTLMHSAINKTTDDPFTGTWREKGGSAKIGELVIAPSGGGFSFQRFMNEEPLVIRYGKEFVDEYPFLEMIEMPPIKAIAVRIDDHTLEFSYRENGNLVLKSTYAVSSDGKRLKARGQYTGGAGKSTIYDRVGPVPEGDAFFGTWQSPLSRLVGYVTIKTDGETIDWYAGDLHVVKAKLDGKNYKGDNYSSRNVTYQFKRLDDHTIEVAMKSGQLDSREAWQVHGNTLTRTTTYISSGDQTSGTHGTSIAEYERIK